MRYARVAGAILGRPDPRGVGLQYGTTVGDLTLVEMASPLLERKTSGWRPGRSRSWNPGW